MSKRTLSEMQKKPTYINLFEPFNFNFTDLKDPSKSFKLKITARHNRSVLPRSGKASGYSKEEYDTRDYGQIAFRRATSKLYKTHRYRSELGDLDMINKLKNLAVPSPSMLRDLATKDKSKRTLEKFQNLSPNSRKSNYLGLLTSKIFQKERQKLVRNIKIGKYRPTAKGKQMKRIDESNIDHAVQRHYLDNMGSGNANRMEIQYADYSRFGSNRSLLNPRIYAGGIPNTFVSAQSIVEASRKFKKMRKIEDEDGSVRALRTLLLPAKGMQRIDEQKGFKDVFMQPEDPVEKYIDDFYRNQERDEKLQQFYKTNIKKNAKKIKYLKNKEKSSKYLDYLKTWEPGYELPLNDETPRVFFEDEKYDPYLASSLASGLNMKKNQTRLPKKEVRYFLENFVLADSKSSIQSANSVDRKRKRKGKYKKREKFVYKNRKKKVRGKVQSL